MDEDAAGPLAYRFGGFTLDLARGALLGPGGAEVPLRPKSFALLRLLVESAGRLLDRDAIMAAVWPDVTVTDDSITQCVRDVRRALGDEAGRLLRTVPRRGYLLAAEVSRARPSPAPADGSPTSFEEAPRQATTGPVGTTTTAGLPSRRIALATAVLLLLALAATGAWWPRPSGTPAGGKPGIAVLPFDNLGGDEATGRLADGLTEDVITDLARFRGLDVIARNSTETYKGKPVDIRQVGKDLDVGYVLEGSIQRQNDLMRVTAQLIDTRTGAHVWTDRWDRPTRDLFAVQAEVAERVGVALGGPMGRGSPAPTCCAAGCTTSRSRTGPSTSRPRCGPWRQISRGRWRSTRTTPRRTWRSATTTAWSATSRRARPRPGPRSP
jgi:TolB-like protein/DNA-binding winged helix-turn-helix (wHTH) protein